MQKILQRRLRFKERRSRVPVKKDDLSIRKLLLKRDRRPLPLPSSRFHFNPDKLTTVINDEVDLMPALTPIKFERYSSK